MSVLLLLFDGPDLPCQDTLATDSSRARELRAAVPSCLSMLSMHRPLRCSPQLSAAPKSGPKMTLQASLGCLALLLCCARGLDNGLARTPQMGWAPWNTFGVHSEPGCTGV